MSKNKTFETAYGYEIQGDMYYDRHTVRAGRSMKDCAFCGDVIPKGQPHTVHKFYGDDGEWPTHATHDMDPVHGDNVQPGEKTCTVKFLEALGQI